MFVAARGIPVQNTIRNQTVSSTAERRLLQNNAIETVGEMVINASDCIRQNIIVFDDKRAFV